MRKFSATHAYVSKGYEGAPAIKFNEAGTACNFRCGIQEYDAQKKENFWSNITCRAFGDALKSIQRMKIDAGACVNLYGTERTERYEKDGKTQYTTVYIVEGIEYAAPARKKDDGAAAPATATTAPETSVSDDDEDEFPFEV